MTASVRQGGKNCPLNNCLYPKMSKNWPKMAKNAKNCPPGASQIPRFLQSGPTPSNPDNPDPCPSHTDSIPHTTDPHEFTMSQLPEIPNYRHTPGKFLILKFKLLGHCPLIPLPLPFTAPADSRPFCGPFTKISATGGSG